MSLICAALPCMPGVKSINVLGNPIEDGLRELERYISGNDKIKSICGFEKDTETVSWAGFGLTAMDCKIIDSELAVQSGYVSKNDESCI